MHKLDSYAMSAIEGNGGNGVDISPGQPGPLLSEWARDAIVDPTVDACHTPSGSQCC